MDGIYIRPLRITDAPDLIACWPELSTHAAHERIANFVLREQQERAWSLIAEYRGRAIGIGRLIRWGRRFEIADLIVLPDWRDRGIGTSVVHRLLELAREKDAVEVEIGVADSNPRALELYKRLGFKNAHQVMIDLGEGPEMVIYLSREP